MTGILVHGDNHWIVEGSCPSENQARELVRRWSMIQIGGSLAVEGWQMRTRAFREDLEWAAEVATGQPRSTAVELLLSELFARGVVLHSWPA